MNIYKCEHGWLVQTNQMMQMGSSNVFPRREWAFSTLDEALKFLKKNIEIIMAEPKK